MRIFRSNRRGTTQEVPFKERYAPGQELELYAGKTLLTNAVVTNYDPTGDTGGSPNHWHVALRDPASDIWYPAAFWEQDPTTIRNHVRDEHIEADEHNQANPHDPEYLAFGVDEMVMRVELLSRCITQIIIKPPEVVPIPLGPAESAPIAMGPVTDGTM